MKTSYIIIFVCISVISIIPQEFIYEQSIGDFKNASSFYINPTGDIYVTDKNTNEIYLIDTLGNLVRSIGGYGWDENSFDNPVDVFADALKVFVSDKNNHRIQRFDKNLNFNFQISTHESDAEAERFGYPLSAVMSNQGDVFILDSENLRIVKFDIFGNFIQNFGGYDYGNYSLQNPAQLAVSMQNNIYVVDGNDILIFDHYGNGIWRAQGNENFSSLRIIFDWLTVTAGNKIYIADLHKPGLDLKEIAISDFDKDVTIVSSLIFNNKLYVLTKNEILIFNGI